MSRSPKSLEQLVAELATLQLDTERVAGLLRALGIAAQQSIDGVPVDLYRALHKASDRSEALALELAGIRWRLQDPVGSRPPKPELVVEPVADGATLEQSISEAERELSDALVALPRATLNLPPELRDALQGVRECIVAASLALKPRPTRAQVVQALTTCGTCGRRLVVDEGSNQDFCAGCQLPEGICSCSATTAARDTDASAGAHLGDGPKADPRKATPPPTSAPTEAVAVVPSFTAGLERFGWTLEGWEAGTGFRASKDGRGVVQALTREELVEASASRDVEHECLAAALDAQGWHFEGWHPHAGWSAWCRRDRDFRLADRDGRELLARVVAFEAQLAASLGTEEVRHAA